MKSLVVAISAAFLASAGYACAAGFVLSFDPAATPGVDTQITEWNEKGMRLSISGTHMKSRDNGVWSYAPSNGTAFIAFSSDFSPEKLPAVLTNSAGHTFALKRVDLAEYSDSIWASDIQFVGYRADTSSVTNVFTLDGDIDGPGPTNDFETFSFSADFTNLSYTVIKLPTGTATEKFSLDNLQIAIPVTSPPALDGIVTTGGVAALSVSNLTTMASNVVERSHDLLQTNWTAAGQFVSTNTTAQWSEPISNSWIKVFYRVRSR